MVARSTKSSTENKLIYFDMALIKSQLEIIHILSGLSLSTEVSPSQISSPLPTSPPLTTLPSTPPPTRTPLIPSSLSC